MLSDLLSSGIIGSGIIGARYSGDAEENKAGSTPIDNFSK